MPKRKASEGIPVHRGKFKERHTRKHALLLQKSTTGYLVSCDLTSEAQTMCEITTILPKIAEFDKKKEDDQNLLGIYDTGCSGLVFAGVRENFKARIDVMELFERVLRQNEHMFRFCKRIFPIEATCSITRDSIRSTLLGLFAEKKITQESSFSAANPFVFSVETRITNCQTMEKQYLIDIAILCIQESLPSDSYSVNLSNPQHTIFIALVKSTAMISILPQYQQRNQYNIQKLLNDK
jgi:tRNA(Ser,Leu) C12 N-acetylase TAN1